MAAVLLAAGALARTMTAQASLRDENMYVTAGVLAGQGSLYSDFAYLQMPHAPLAYRALFALTGTSHYLLAARALSVALLLLAALLVYLISRRLTGALDVSLLLTLLFVLNANIAETMSYAWGAALGIPLSLLAVYGLPAQDAQRPAFRMSLCGFFVGLAVGTKAYYLAAAPPLLLACAVHGAPPRRVARVATSAASFLAGMILGLLPASYYFRRHADVFVFDNVVFHRLNTMWRREIGYEWTMGPFSKLQFLKGQWEDPSNVALLVALLFLAARGLRPAGGTGLVARGLRPDLLLCAGLVAATTAGALLPTPLWPHYFAMPVPFVVLLLAALCRQASDAGDGEMARTALRVAVIICVAFALPRMLTSLAALRHRDRWVPLVVHDTGVKIRAQVLKPGGDGRVGRVATLSPMYAVEAGLPIYPELATGVFLYRVGDFLSSAERERYVATSPRTLAGLLDADPPSAVVTGGDKFEGELEAPFVAYAEQRGYEKQDVGGLRLYLRRGDAR
jgi:hypothetical protein